MQVTQAFLVSGQDLGPRSCPLITGESEIQDTAMFLMESQAINIFPVAEVKQHLKHSTVLPCPHVFLMQRENIFRESSEVCTFTAGQIRGE